MSLMTVLIKLLVDHKGKRQSNVALKSKLHVEDGLELYGLELLGLHGVQELADYLLLNENQVKWYLWKLILQMSNLFYLSQGLDEVSEALEIAIELKFEVGDELLKLLPQLGLDPIASHHVLDLECSEHVG